MMTITRKIPSFIRYNILYNRIIKENSNFDPVDQYIYLRDSLFKSIINREFFGVGFDLQLRFFPLNNKSDIFSIVGDRFIIDETNNITYKFTEDQLEWLNKYRKQISKSFKEKIYQNIKSLYLEHNGYRYVLDHKFINLLDEDVPINTNSPILCRSELSQDIQEYIKLYNA